MRSVCVYCGSSMGRLDVYAATARAVAKAFVDRGLRLIYGGASVGIMGALADEVLRLGGQAVGVIPESLARREVAHRSLTELHVTQTMHERKMLMATLADAFIALPGGIGTLEEIFEIWTWAQLGIHDKPCGLLNVNGYFDPLLSFLDRAVTEQFVRPAVRSMLFVDTEPEELLSRFVEQHRQSGGTPNSGIRV